MATIDGLSSLAVHFDQVFAPLRKMFRALHIAVDDYLNKPGPAQVAEISKVQK